MMNGTRYVKIVSEELRDLTSNEQNILFKGHFTTSNYLALKSPMWLMLDLGMNLDQTKDMELARNLEPGDENGSKPDTPITTDNSEENCEIRQNLENVGRKYSNLTRDLGMLIKN
ncbi:hypothetical protein NPIL_657651 [Nephila pilipes]|uniref:Uncharacterized protein n=1 Tax=Nephila pilipes TaxID=299642 RepID=A0A8X6NS50_NEPPI|nr:hypothetical protein NPIL_657651 [Nephila pilipes]